MPSEASSALASTLSMPPATLYGWVVAGLGFQPQAGDPVTAWIKGHLCGSGSVQPWLGALAYKAQVAADGNHNGCGAQGSLVIFKVGGVEFSSLG